MVPSVTFLLADGTIERELLQQTNHCSLLVMAASTRSEPPSFAVMWCPCFLTVLTLTRRSLAIC